ncbi:MULTISPECIES: MarR family winged helix-turn-helix transcriptional regulator [unclassified Streptomyces]|uniref:MarR family winged helix-turn-helix transcriptional regulator n=1 Tax=unclassified Streptomyces TaxID=2593676 RepID=UPI0006C04B51|nr:MULTISPECIES: MarR family transcriptional regulator [unclassified Streptomyces]KOX23800.1 MarR family transcriptional regulator [Streptomyces sp. NRRL F-6491]KOX40800.1 MarR family transcriptional regulator [Streptomyces sp. NRRL F-6492]
MAAALPNDRLGFLLSFRGELTGARIRTALGVAGLHPRSVMTLMQLAPGAMSQRDLAAAMEVDPSQLVAILNELEDQGLAERRRDPADRRRHIVEITRTGAAALERVDTAVNAAERELFGDLTDAEQALLRSLLDRVVVDPADHACGEG